MAIMPIIPVIAPPVTPRRFGLLSVADIKAANLDNHLAGSEFEGLGCVPALGVASDVCTASEPKTITPEDDRFLTGFSFATYVIRECRAVGDFDGAKDRAVHLHAMGEQNAVEIALWDYLINHADTDVLSAAASPLTPEEGVAILEKWGGQVYAGDLTLHVTRDIGSVLGESGVVERHGNVMETVQGSKVASGGGYGDAGPGAAAAPGVSWIIATGNVFGVKGVAHAHGPDFVQPMDNSTRVMVERTYNLNVDCAIAAVPVQAPETA